MADRSVLFVRQPSVRYIVVVVVVALVEQAFVAIASWDNFVALDKRLGDLRVTFGVPFKFTWKKWL